MTFDGKEAFLQVARVRVSSSSSEREINVLLDDGSTDSYVSERVVSELKALRCEVPRRLVTTLGGRISFQLCQKTLLGVKAMDGSYSTTCQFRVMPNTIVAGLPVPGPGLRESAAKRGLRLVTPNSEDGRVDIDMLVGVDLIVEHFMVMPPEAVVLRPGVAACHTRIGWVLMGKEADGSFAGSFHALTQDEEGCESCKDLRKLYDDPIAGGGEVRDRVSEEWSTRYESSLAYDAVDRRFTARLPWLSPDMRPRCNYHAAKAQCESLRRRLLDTGKYEEYDRVIRTLVQEGSAEEAPPGPPRGYYTPHHPVYKDSSTTQIRPVFNASSRVRGLRSLNECIFKGTWQQTQLLDLLVRWRLHKFVVFADLKKAFLQIRVHPEDRQFLRFLWYEGDRLRTYQMTSVLFGATASPYMLYAALHRLFADFALEKYKDFPGSLYMDDGLFFATTMEHLAEVIQQVREVLRRGSFELHKWAAPNWLQREFPAVSRAITFEETEIHKALGVSWNLRSDSITFSAPAQPPQLTRRQCASMFGSVFDPLGLLGAFVTRVKLFMRRVLEQSTDWDQPLSEHLSFEAAKLTKELQQLPKFSVPRPCVSVCAYELWVFADASAAAYGACVYVYSEGAQRGSLLLSRSKLSSPSRTIPQLELCAAVLAAQTYGALCKEFSGASRVRFFTDSMVTLCRIQSNPNQHEPFVANRVRVIQETTEPEHWRHVDTKLNPADLISRGTAMKALITNQLWLQGPAVASLALDRPLRTYVTNTLPLPNVGAKLDKQFTETPFPKLLQVITSILEYMQSRYDLLSRIVAEKGREINIHQLAVIRIWQFVQSKTLAEEIRLVESKKPPKCTQLQSKALFVDAFGLLRENRRLQNAEHLDWEVKEPIIVKDHPLVRSYVRWVHESRLNHLGADSTRDFVNRCVSFVGGSGQIRKIVKECAHCNRFRGSPYDPPEGPLPVGRVTASRAFDTIGVDIFGPIYDGPKPRRGRGRRKVGKEQKYYGLLFVCAASRAVHLELIHDRSADSVLLAIHRFFSRRGVPHFVFSDNEAAFKKASEILCLYQYTKWCRKKLSTKPGYTHLKWQFNPPESPWWGGFYERLVGTVKCALKGFRPQRHYGIDELQTMLALAEALVNSRPLYKCSDAEPAITPAHLMLGYPLVQLEAVPAARTLARAADDSLINYVGLQRKLNSFWRIWANDYLASLRSYHRKKPRVPRLGELVIVQARGAPRGEWPMGIVKEVISSPDNVARLVKVWLLKEQELKEKPARLLIPLEDAK